MTAVLSTSAAVVCNIYTKSSCVYIYIYRACWLLFDNKKKIIICGLKWVCICVCMSVFAWVGVCSCVCLPSQIRACAARSCHVVPHHLGLNELSVISLPEDICVNQWDASEVRAPGFFPFCSLVPLDAPSAPPPLTIARLHIRSSAYYFPNWIRLDFEGAC